MKTIEVMLSRTIPATPKEVFDVWMDPKVPGSPWFGSGRAIISKPEVDGLFYHSTISSSDNRSYAHYGRFTKIEPPALVEYTWVSEATHGTETLVRVEFRAAGDDTELTLTHFHVPDSKEGARHREGWVFVLDAVKHKFEKAKGLTK